MQAASVAVEVAPPADSIVEIERSLIDGLIIEPSEVTAVRLLVTESDFYDPLARHAFRAFLRNPKIDGLVALRDYLVEVDEIGLVGGPGIVLSQLGNRDVGPSVLPHLAEGVLLASLERQMRAAARRVEKNPGDRVALDELVALREQFEQRRPGDASEIQLADISFSADRFMALLDEPAPDPVYPAVPPRGHFSLMIAPPFAGKTSLVLWVAMAHVRGQAPWIGAPAEDPGRVLFYSLDEAPGQVVHRIKSLSVSHPAGRMMSSYAHRFTIVGPHRDVDPAKLEKLRFNEDGLANLRRFIEEAQGAGDPFSLVIIDSYGDVKASDQTNEDQNDQAARIGSALERIAVSYNCAIQMIHHTGKPLPGGATPDPRNMGLGASQLSAKARAIFTCEEEPGAPHLRKIRTRANLTESPAPFFVEVSEERNSERQKIDFFRPHDPATAYPINDYLVEEDGWITSSELARRVSGQADGKPSGTASAHARNLRSIWLGADLIETRKGSQNSMELRRKPRE